MANKVYLVRHGEIENPLKIIYGRLPGFKLTKKGIKQVEETANFLKGKGISSIYSSPIQRALETAEIIKKFIPVPKIAIIPDLIEVDTYLEGQKEEGLDILNIDYYSPKLLKGTNETMEQIAERMYKALQKMFSDNSGKSVIAVSHGDPIMILRAYIQGLPMKIKSIRDIPYIKHGEVFEFEKNDDSSVSVKSVFIPNI